MLMASTAVEVAVDADISERKDSVRVGFRPAGTPRRLRQASMRAVVRHGTRLVTSVVACASPGPLFNELVQGHSV
jgi:hypothetical protein